MDGVVAVIEGVDTETDDLERARAARRREDAAVEVGHARGELALPRREAVPALPRRRELDAGVGELVGGLALGTDGILVGARCLDEARGELLGALLGVGGSRAVLLDVCSGLRRLGRRGVTGLRDLRELGRGGVDLALQATELRDERRELAVETGDLALGMRARVARLRQGGFRGRDGSCGVLALPLERGHAVLERADAPLALERAGLRRGVRADDRAPVGKDGHARGRDVGESRHRRVSGHGLGDVLDDADVTDERIEKPAGVVGHAETVHERGPGSLRGGHPARLGARDHRRTAVDLRERERTRGDGVHVIRRGNDEGGEVVAEEPLDEGVDARVGVDEVGEPALGLAGDDVVRRHGSHEGARLLDVGIDGAQRGERRLGGREPLAGDRLLPAGVGEHLLPGGDGGHELLGRGPLGGEVGLDGTLARRPLRDGLPGGPERLVDLLETRGIHPVLDLGVGDLVLELGVRERLAVGLRARGAFVGGDPRQLGVEGATARDGVARDGRELLAVHPQLVLADDEVSELVGHARTLRPHVGALLLHRRKLHTHVGEARNHVLALLLQKTHVGLHAAEDVLHAAPLLAEVAHEEALLLKKGLELVELAGLLVIAVLGELDGGVRLVAAGGELAVALLELTEVVHGELDGEVGELVGEVAGLTGLVHLALEGLELAGYLARDDLRAREVRVHGGELALGALLATPVFGDVGGLLDELAPLLGAAREDGVELALRDDRVRVDAESRVMQDVADVHKPRRGAVDEVLGLARAVHAPGDGNLGELDGQRVIGVVEHERDLGEADGLPCGRAREDHVLHRLTAKHLGALLAEDPEDGVGDVGLPRPVGTDDHGETRVEDHLGLVREGLEAFEGERLEIHVRAPFVS